MFEKARGKSLWKISIGIGKEFLLANIIITAVKS